MAGPPIKHYLLRLCSSVSFSAKAAKFSHGDEAATTGTLELGMKVVSLLVTVVKVHLDVLGTEQDSNCFVTMQGSPLKLRCSIKIAS